MSRPVPSTPDRTSNPRCSLVARSISCAALGTVLAVILGLAQPVLAQTQQALQFDGANDYVTFGTAPSLGASNFTVEVRFKRAAGGATTSTGSGGVTAYPLVAKGRAELDGSNVDMNYFLGIDAAGHLVGDFEDTATGLNHPVTGATVTSTGVWYHAALTFDGSNLRVYLNGVQDGVTSTTATPRFDSIQHASLASALTSSGAAAGFFSGVLDEARIWNVARSQSDIQANMGVEIASATGLIGRFSLNEGAGTNAGNSIAGSADGTLTNGPTWTTDSTIPLASESGLRFGGTSGYVTFGNAAPLKLATFTLETWFRRDGAGTTTSTGTGGVTNAIPLLAKGRGEDENAAVDMNYFLGIRASDNVLFADFEEGAGGSSPSLNHPVIGVTPITNGIWYHAAATYDGNKWQLFLNGALEAELVVGQPVAEAGGQHASLATGLTSTGVAAGFFNGALDEARIWSVARTQSQIQSTMNSALTGSTSGLVARWGLNEDAQTTVHSTAGTTIDGAITGAGWSWAAGSPFNAVPPSPPADPSGLVATAVGASQIDLAWTDNSSNEIGFQIERSTEGSGGTFTLRATVGAGVQTYSDVGLSALSEYCYRVRAVSIGGSSGYTNTYCAMTGAAPNMALDFTGTNAYVSFGNPTALHLSAFTIEMWMRRDGAGVGTDTGTNGIPDAIPLLARGRAESEAAAVDINYFLGIKASSGTLCADFEEGAVGASPSGNHPILGTTAIGTGTWHHVAATYDGATWKLYLDGALDAQLAVGQPVAEASNVAAALGSALNSTNVASGFFDGAVDEVRVWNMARSLADIQSTINSQITTATSGLVARWALDEGAGTAVNGSAGTAVNGTITGTGYAWAGGAPFDISFTPPAAPTGLSAGAVSNTQVNLSWTDNATNEASYEVERSTSGIGGSYSPLATLAANTTSYPDMGLSASTEYCYRVRAVNGSGSSGYAGPNCATTLAQPTSALDLGGSTYASFGNVLQLSQFTIEMWMRRDGTGVGTDTGSGGIADLVPLLAKGRAESEAAAVDVNYIVGVRASTGVLGADFEEGASGTAPSQNHPVLGTTAIPVGGWHHVAATYDGTTWKLYLDGNLEASLAVGQPVASASTVAVALGSALNSTNVASGFFDGALDEVRVWNYARTQAQIQSTANAQVGSATSGLVARWALDEGAGTAVNGSAGTALNGTITGTSYAWISGAPFNLSFNLPPAQPALNTPADNASGISASPTLNVAASDPDGGNLTVTFYGREVTSTAGPDFTLVGLPDTQYYTGALNGGSAAIINSQTQWIVDNRASRNIAYAVQLGDCVEHGDNGGDPIEWTRADAAFDLIENPTTTGLSDGVPYGICAGNHDQTPIGDADGSTAFYNQYFGVTRFQGRGYYGGHYGSNNDNWYDLFSASGMDFIVVSFEYDTTPDAAVLSWADGLLTTYANRRAIVASHWICNTGNPGSFSGQGQAIYNALRGHSNLFLMLCGHVPGEGRRSDTFGGNTVNTLLSDYQSRTNGGNGWLRILEFSPANNVIRVRTYSPWLNQFENDADSQFDLAYAMGTSSGPFQTLGSVVVPSGTNATLQWTPLNTSTQYEWYATVSDGSATTTGPVWRFTTGVVDVAEAAVHDFGLGDLAPNPFASGTRFSFSLPREARVRLGVMDIQGREVAVLANGVYAAGRHPVSWSGNSDHGRLPAGLYFMRLEVAGKVYMRRAVIIH